MRSVLKHARSQPPRPLRELPLAECEHHLTVWTEHGIGQQVIDDMRRTAIAQLRAQQLNRWCNKPPADTMDGTFACSALLDTSRVVLAAGTAAQQAVFMHIATSSMQCCWQLQPDGTCKVLPLRCSSCNATLTLQHLSTCAADTGSADVCGRYLSHGFGSGPVGNSQVPEQPVFNALITGVNEGFCIEARFCSRTLHSTVPLFNWLTCSLLALE